MLLGLALFYRGGALPVAASGLLLFGALALLRPRLGLLFVPLTAPLYLIPAAIQGIRADEFLLPLHEAALLAVTGATLVSLFGRAGALPTLTRHTLCRAAPYLLLLVAGIGGVALAVPEGRAAALRELRWMIVEPLIFYGVLAYHARRSPASYQRCAAAFAAGGALVALLGLLQLAGLDLVPLLGQKRAFAENVVEAGGVRRAASVYGHPNNLGLYLGRVWPLAAALALGSARRGRRALFALSALLGLGGLLASFSRGAWMGAAAAGMGLVWWIGRGRGPHPFGSAQGRPPAPSPAAAGEGEQAERWPAALGVAALLGLAGLVGLTLLLRGELIGGSAGARLLLWREALALIREHPFGLGLDQFYYYHNPEFGRSRMHPSLAGTSEQFAAHPHNLILDIWLRLGPLGLIAFAWLFARFIRAGLQTARIPTLAPYAAGALAALAALLIHGLVDSFYFFPDLALAFWLLFALAEAGSTPHDAGERASP